jgi:hypothetical protein
MASAPDISPSLLEALPVSFSSFCLDRMKDWDLLFPAERGYFERLFALLARSGDTPILFAPLREIERKMGVNDKTFPKGQFTLEQVDFLNRNSYYAEWRAAIAQIFARLDPVLDAEVVRTGHSRLVIVIAPAQLPASPDRMWTRLAAHGQRVALDTPEDAGDFIPLLLTGARGAPTIAESFSTSRKGGPYTSWIVEAGADVARMAREPSPAVKCSYELLEPYRKRLMKEVQAVVDTKEIPGPRQLSARLKQMKILASEGEVARDPILAEFARAILLSGNGTLLINNTFVEWATVQAVRRARPSVVIAGFGIRNKVKPFSSLLIYADQETANPIPSQMDVLGSYVDLEIFYQYIWQEFQKYPEYRNNTACLFVADGMEEMLAIGPPDFPVLSAGGPLKLAALHSQLKDWLGIQA